MIKVNVFGFSSSPNSVTVSDNWQMNWPEHARQIHDRTRASVGVKNLWKNPEWGNHFRLRFHIHTFPESVGGAFSKAEKAVHVKLFGFLSISKRFDGTYVHIFSLILFVLPREPFNILRTLFWKRIAISEWNYIQDSFDLFAVSFISSYKNNFFDMF